MNIILQILCLVIGFAMLIKGADWFVEGASKIADKFGIPQLVIGLTIVALGTSAPEAAVSISAALKGSAEITIGNVVGSNIMNVLVILGLTAVIRSISIPISTIKYEIPFVILVTGILVFLGLHDGKIVFVEGIIFWGFMILYLVYLFKMTKNEQSTEMTEENEEKEDENMLKAIVLAIIGVGLIVWGSDVTVNAATELAKLFGMSERLIGLTIVALGTSLPELVTSATAAIKGNSDIAIGNIVGSNIFNILFVVGTTALITPVAYSSNFMVDSFVAIGAVVLLLVLVLKNKKLGRIGGISLLIGYGAYFLYLIQ